MSLIKRLSTSLVASLDQVVGSIENHDAVIQASLKDMRGKIAAARQRLSQVQSEATRLEDEIAAQRQQAAQWQRRALATAQTDESKALECMRRARACEQQSQQLQTARQPYAQTLARLRQDIDSSEQRLRELQQKHSLLRARQASGVALNATGGGDVDTIRQLDDSFERWEVKLAQLDICSDNRYAQPEPMDALQQAFESDEQTAELRRALDELLQREQP